MTNKEDYELKRKNFIEKTIKFFHYLCDEYKYLLPVHSTHQQPNGVIIADSLDYLNESIDRLVIIYNAYHPNDYGFEVQFYRPSNPNDYGFEVQFYRPSISTNPPDRVIVYPVLKEDQDIDQTYLEKAAESVHNNFQTVLMGNEWNNST